MNYLPSLNSQTSRLWVHSKQKSSTECCASWPLASRIRVFILVMLFAGSAKVLRCQVIPATAFPEADNSLITDTAFFANNSLQILMSTVTVQQEGDKATRLEWKTFREFNCGRFVIENSRDGVTWDQLGALPGQGDSFEEKLYSYTHSMAPAGDNYYRVKQYDKAGDSLATSNISFIRITFPKRSGICENPVRDKLTIIYDGKQIRRASVFSIFGEQLQVDAVRCTDDETSFDVSRLASGIYYLQFDDRVFQFIKQ